VHILDQTVVFLDRVIRNTTIDQQLLVLLFLPFAMKSSQIDLVVFNFPNLGVQDLCYIGLHPLLSVVPETSTLSSSRDQCITETSIIIPRRGMMIIMKVAIEGTKESSSKNQDEEKQ
jgi:hypothetical protein